MKKFKGLFVTLVAVMFLLSGCSQVEQSKSATNTTPQQVATNNDVKDEAVNVVLYLPTDDAKGVKSQTVSIKKSEVSPKKALELLIASDSKKDYPTLPKDLKVLQVDVKDGIAFVTFNDVFSKTQAGGTLMETLELASIVNTLTEFKDITSVVFLVDGKPVTRLRGGNMDLTEPITRMKQSIVK